MENRKTTIKELARHANVSISTVSKALKDSSEISETTKKKIQKLAKQHQYSPNNLAVSFKSGRSQLIGVVLPHLSEKLYANILYGIEQQAKANDYKIIISFSNDLNKLEKEITARFYKSSIDGLIILPCSETLRKDDFVHFNKIAENGIPTFFLNCTTTLLENGSQTEFGLSTKTQDVALHCSEHISQRAQKSSPYLEFTHWMGRFQELFNTKPVLSFSVNSFEKNRAENSKDEASYLSHLNKNNFKKSMSSQQIKGKKLSKNIKMVLIHPEANQNGINIGKLASQAIIDQLSNNL